MADRNSDIVWQRRREFVSNQPRNEKPALADITIEDDTILPKGRKGEALYVYDFGGLGDVTELEWEGDGFVSFRYKVSETREALNQTEFIGSHTERFVGSQLDTSEWNSLPGPYIIVQNNQLKISGATDDYDSIYQNQGIVEKQNVTEFPAAFEVRMKLEKLKDSSGSKVFLGITDGVNTILLQKFYEKLKISSPRAGVEVNTNVGNHATVVVTRNGTIIFQDDKTSKLTDGVLEGINYDDIPVNAIDTLINLKRYATVTTVEDDPSPFGIAAEAIPFRVRGDYNPSQTPTGLFQYVHYDLTRDAGFYRATVPVLNRKLDLYETKIDSFNWNPTTRKYEEADTDNIWKIALTLPPGVHRYNFWVDGEEVPDVTNPNSYYLDADNKKVSIFPDGYGYDGTGYGYGPEYSIPKGVPFFSELILEETQTVEFVYQGYGDVIALVGTFNDYNAKTHLMNQEVDRQLIRRLADPNFLYVNSNEDYHKIEIVLPYRMSIDTIDFKTLIPLKAKQRVKIYLDEVAVSKLDWNLVPGDTEGKDYIEGFGDGSALELSLIYGYGYGVPVTGYGVHYGYGTGYGIDYGYGYSQGYGQTAAGYGYGLEQTCPILQSASCNLLAAATTTFSYWDNNTDTITASEDGVVRWCLKDGLTRTAQKITFLTRIEGSSNKTRKHVALDFYGTINQAHTVTDYAFSDAYTDVQKTHTTYATPLMEWKLPIFNLNEGLNELTPTTYDSNGNPVFGDPVTIQVKNNKPSVWELNRSEWAAHSVEVIYGIAGQLRAPPTKMFSVTDDRSLNIAPTAQPNERFVDLNVVKTVELLNVQAEPRTTLVVKLKGRYSTFQLDFYETLEDARTELNLLGSVVADSYGEKFPADFTGTADPQGRAGFFAINKFVEVAGQSTQVLVGQIVATYEKGGSDKTIQVGQVR